MSLKEQLNPRTYKEHIKQHKAVFAVYILLRTLVIGAMVTSCIRGYYENVFYCGLALFLFLLPAFFEKNLGIGIPNVLEILILLFIFAAIIMGEMNSFYTKIPIWDTVLHTINGFLCAAVGFGMVDILNRNERIKFSMSPIFMAVVAFCFSMTIGVLWEFFEFGCDMFFGTDMQKDFVVNSINSTLLSGDTKEVMAIKEIEEVTVNGNLLNTSGYIDVGLYDTMKDLLVNFIGALVFSVIGYIYIKTRGRNKIAGHFIPTLLNGKDDTSEE